ncbi:MAG: radical SAM protein [Candidatus Nanoarchaeia archaeon]
MKIKEVKAKSVITKTNLPEGDYVINPYVGCSHACKYCYARFMKRFTGHLEEWGSFVDVKVNAPELIPIKIGKLINKSITIGSVCDPYQEVEKKYKITRRILEKLMIHQPKLDILTKSPLITRDIDLIKQFKDVKVAISLSMLDEDLRKKLEPGAPDVNERLNALKQLHQARIRTVLFISPIFPEITDWQKMIEKTKELVTEYWFENLNLYPSIRENTYSFLKENKPKLINIYQEIYSVKSNYWIIKEKEIKEFCKNNQLKTKIYFHHQAQRKSI